MAESGMTSAVVRIDFHGDELVSWKDDETGEVIVSIREMCKNIGISAQTQLAKLRENPSFAEGIRGKAILTPGGKQETHGLLLELVPGWLATINPARIKDTEVRETLVMYQKESYKALNAYWTTGVALRTETSPPAPLALPSPKETLEDITACVETLKMLGTFDDRDKITFGAYVRQVAQLAMTRATGTPLLPQAASAPQIWTLSMRLQHLGYPPLRGSDGESLQIKIGSMAARRYRQEYKTDPPKMWDYVKGQQRPVNAYEEERVEVLDTAIKTYLPRASGIQIEEEGVVYG